MADAVATYAVNLEDGTSAPANAAVEALKRLQAQMSADQSALKQLEAAFKRLNAAQVVDIRAAKDLRAAIAAKKQAIGEAQAKIIGLGGALSNTSNKGKAALSFMDKLREATKAAPGPLQQLIARFGSLQGLVVAGGIAVGIIAITAATIALTAAAVAGSVALFGYAVAHADARRSELLRLEGLTKLRFWYQAAAGSARELQDATDRVSSGVSLGRDQVARYTEQLYRAGLRGAGLEQALEAVAIKAAVQGDAAASSFAGWAAGTALAGGSVKRLADDVKARLGGIAARQMLALDVQTKKMRENFAALFNGLDVEPLLRGMRLVTDLFSQSTVTGRALKTLLTTIFQPLINHAETAGLIVKRFFQGFVIAALTVGIQLLRVRNWLRATFGASDVLRSVDVMSLAVHAGAAAFGAFTLALTATASVLALLSIPFVVAGAALMRFYENVRAGIELVSDMSQWVTAGMDICRGIVNGVKNGAVWVIDSLKALGTSAYAAFKKKLGIASPSKEFAKLGIALPQGVQQGVEKGAPAAQDAVRAMVSVPTPSGDSQAAAARAAGAVAPTTSIQVTIGDIVVQGSQVKDTAGLVETIRKQLIEELEAALFQLGGKLAGA